MTFPLTMEHICQGHLLPSASLVDSGSSFLLVSGSKKPRNPLTSVRLLKTVVGMAQWYVARMLSSGATNPPALADMFPKAVAVCLKDGHYNRHHVHIINEQICLLEKNTIYFWMYSCDCFNLSVPECVKALKKVYKMIYCLLKMFLISSTPTEQKLETTPGQKYHI